MEGWNGELSVILDLPLSSAKAATGSFYVVDHDHTWSGDAPNGSKMKTT